MINRYSTDVLVIGGGGAGIRAALEASNNGSEVILAVKGKVKKSGSSSSELSEISGYNAYMGLDSNDSREKFLEDICLAGENMCDKKLAQVLVNNADDSVRDLEKMGVDFEKIDGKYLFFKCCFSRYARALTLFRQGRKIIEKLSEKAFIDSRIKVYENLFIIDLLIKDGKCSGAIGIEKNKDIIIIRAKVTILATGGFGGIFKNRIVPADVTGDGHAMALRAGCELVNLEFFQMGFATLYPKLVLFESWLWGIYPKMINGKGIEFLTNYLPENKLKNEVFTLHSFHFPFSTRDNGKFLEISTQNEVLKGNTTEHGGIYLDFTFCDKEYLDKRFKENSYLKLFFNKSYERLKKNQIDIFQNPVEVNVFSHATNGGVKINTNAESSIKNLFAVGEVSGGVHGADRLGGNMLATAQVFGKIAGNKAAKIVKNEKLDFNDNEEKEKIDKINQIMDRVTENKKGDHLVQRYHSIRKTMSDTALIIREESRINQGLHQLSLLRQELESDYIYPSHIFLAFENYNMIDTGNALLKAIQERRESRGAHYRSDFPEKNDKYEKNIIINKKNNCHSDPDKFITTKWEKI